MKKKTAAFLAFGLLAQIAAGSLWAEVDTKSVRVSFEVRPVFMVKTVSNSSGVPDVDFGWVLPAGDPSQGEILDVTVATNTVKPYKIYQMATAIRSDEGAAPPESTMKFRVTPGRAGGETEASGYEELKPGKRLIFSSRSGGGADQFQIHYQLGESEVLDAGNYYGSVTINGELS